MPKKWKRLYNEDCITGAKKYIKDDSVDLIITDPPYGINGESFDKHYNRDDKHVLKGYIEVSKGEYPEFSRRWIKQAERVLRPGGSIYIISGYSQLVHILNVLQKTDKLEEINHIIWQYNFGVYTKKKFVSSHYHILYYAKKGGERTFNTYSRYGHTEKDEDQKSENYRDRIDVFEIPRLFEPGKKKVINKLPEELITKLIQYSSNEKDVVCDFFLGGFTTAKVALKLNRKIIGFEKSKSIFNYYNKRINDDLKGTGIDDLRVPDTSYPANQGKKWNNVDIEDLKKRFNNLYPEKFGKIASIKIIMEEMGRGYFSILNALKKYL